MSGVSARTPFGFRPAVSRKRQGGEEEARQDTPRPWETGGVSRETRKGFIWGALSAALLIALAFIVGLGLVIGLIVLIYT